MKKTAGDVPGVKSGAKPSKLQLAMAEKNQAKSGKQKMFKVEEACCIRFSPNSKRLAVGSRDNNIYIFDVEKNFVELVYVVDIRRTLHILILV